MLQEFWRFVHFLTTMAMFNYLYLFYFIASFVSAEETKLSQQSLIMVHALFRHGERTTETFYPTDPYINETFYPYGKGGLTNRGKLQEYKLGQFLRNNYNNFLDNIYSNDIMKVRSTGFLRTRMSALLVAAGLWPPSKPQIWNEQLPWLPIPVDYKPYEDDDLLNPGACLKRIQVLKQQIEIEDVRKQYVIPHNDLMKYIEKHSGKSIKSPTDISELYLILKTEDDTNYVLPRWTKSIYPEPLHTAASKVYSYFNYNSEMKKINAGYFFKKILEDFNAKTKRQENLAKIYLYSGHESTLGHMLDALKVDQHVSPYGSVVLFELHKLLDNFYIRILYKRRTHDDNLEYIIYPGCETDCLLSKFENLIQDMIPNIPYNEACKI